jgi:hypothetical protein
VQKCDRSQWGKITRKLPSSDGIWNLDEFGVPPSSDKPTSHFIRLTSF